MQILAIFVIIFGFLTVLSLVVGIATMAKGGEFNQKYGNKLMTARVAFQALTIGSLILLMVSKGA
jgi:hypothetical protein